MAIYCTVFKNLNRGNGVGIYKPYVLNTEHMERRDVGKEWQGPTINNKERHQSRLNQVKT